MLYKEYDRPFLEKSGIKNSITALSKKTTLIISAFFFVLSIIFFILLCLDSVYFRIDILGSLPVDFLWLLPLFAPPIIMQYFLFFKKIKIDTRYIRVAGLVLLLLLIVIVFLMSK